MKVREIMTHTPEFCTPDTDLAAAAMIMWREDCGIVPVVNQDQDKVIGMITDRDICMAAATRHRCPEEIRVGEVISGRLVSSGPDEEIDAVLDLMRLEQVRRLPIVGEDDSLIGIVSINDVILNSHLGKGRRHSAATAEQVLHAMKGICEHRALPMVSVRELAALANV